MSTEKDQLAGIIRASITDPSGAGSDLHTAEVQEGPWVEVGGSLDVEHLAGDILHMLTPPKNTPSDVELAAAAVVQAWTEPGPCPPVHHQAIKELHEKWPTLAVAVERLARAAGNNSGGQLSRPMLERNRKAIEEELRTPWFPRNNSGVQA